MPVRRWRGHWYGDVKPRWIGHEDTGMRMRSRDGWSLPCHEWTSHITPQERRLGDSNFRGPSPGRLCRILLTFRVHNLDPRLVNPGHLSWAIGIDRRIVNPGQVTPTTGRIEHQGWMSRVARIVKRIGESGPLCWVSTITSRIGNLGRLCQR